MLSKARRLTASVETTQFPWGGEAFEQAPGVGNSPLLGRSPTAGLDPFVLLEVAEDDGGGAGRDARLLGESSGAEPGAWCEQEAVDDLGAAAPEQALDATCHRARRGPVGGAQAPARALPGRVLTRK